MTADLHQQLATALGSADCVSTEEAVCVAYAGDNSRRIAQPDMVVWPQSEEHVAAALRVANDTRTPVAVRGRGTATTGASLAKRGGIVLSTERLDRILKIDPSSRTATAEAGVLNGALDQALAEYGLCWPPDPSSSNYCSLGGNLATAAAGPRGLKYGGTRENVLALRAVSGGGVPLVAGAPVPKAVAGYDLARLLLGSEGTLAVITAATLKLSPLPVASQRALAVYASEREALEAVGALLQSQLVLAAIEFIDAGCLELVRGAAPDLDPASKALLLLEVDGMNDEGVTAGIKQLDEVLAPTPGLLAFDASATGAGLWSLRKVLSQKLREVASCKINEDVVVPVSRLPELLDHIQSASKEAQLRNLNFGHAGQGNLHVNILFDDEGDNRARAAKLVESIMAKAVELDGCISGEHGVGLAKQAFLPMQLHEGANELGRSLKEAFDPNDILNGHLLLPAS